MPTRARWSITLRVPLTCSTSGAGLVLRHIGSKTALLQKRRRPGPAPDMRQDLELLRVRSRLSPARDTEQARPCSGHGARLALPRTRSSTCPARDVEQIKGRRDQPQSNTNHPTCPPSPSQLTTPSGSLGKRARVGNGHGTALAGMGNRTRTVNPTTRTERARVRTEPSGQGGRATPQACTGRPAPRREPRPGQAQPAYHHHAPTPPRPTNQAVHPVKHRPRPERHRSSSDSMPIVRPGRPGRPGSPGRPATRRTASSTPGMNDSRSTVSCRMVRVSPVEPNSTS